MYPFTCVRRRDHWPHSKLEFGIGDPNQGIVVDGRVLLLSPIITSLAIQTNNLVYEHTA